MCARLEAAAALRQVGVAVDPVHAVHVHGAPAPHSPRYIAMSLTFLT